MSNIAREKTLADYLGALRRGWVIMVVAALVCGGGALAASLIVKPKYEAQASVEVQDPNEALLLTGIGVPTNLTPLQLALSHAAQVTRPAVLQNVEAQLNGSPSAPELRRLVTVSVDPNSALVDITAHSSSAVQAAAIANAFARDDAAQATATTRREYILEAKRLTRIASAASPATRSAYLAQAARLQTASSIASPVQVNTTARVPSAPSSPRPVRNTLAGLVFGLLFGMLLAYGRNELDHRLQNPSDVEALLDHPVIGAVRGAALGRASAKSDPDSSEEPELAPADQESFRVLRQNVRYLAASPLQLVLVTSAMAEEGKSTVAAGLAAVTAAAGKRTLLVECDLRRSVLASRLGLPEAPGLTDYLTGHAGAGEVVRSVQPLPASPNGAGPHSASTYTDGQQLYCITAGTSAPRPTELLASEQFRSFLSQATQDYDEVILDSPPLLTVADALEIIPEVSGLLVCVRLGQTTRDQARGFKAALERLPTRPVGIVLTDVKTSGSGYYGYYGAR